MIGFGEAARLLTADARKITGCGHNLPKLWAELGRHVAVAYPDEWTELDGLQGPFVELMHDVDRAGTTYRYPVNLSGDWRDGEPPAVKQSDGGNHRRYARP